MGERGREGDGWGTAPRTQREQPARKPKRYEEDHGMPASGPGCGSGPAKHGAPKQHANPRPTHAPQPVSSGGSEDNYPRGEGGELEWLS